MIKLKRFEKGEWLSVPGLNGVRVKIRPITLSKSASIISQFKRKVVVDGDVEEALKIATDYDEYAAALAIFNYILEDFEGIEVEGNPSEDEQREAIYDNDFLREFITESAASLRDDAQTELDKDIKNSKTSQSG